MRPPASKKAAMTSAHSSLSTGSPPTLNVIHVPNPTMGMASRVEGISRRAGKLSRACGDVGKSAAAAVAREARRNVRRVVRIRCSIIAAGKFLQNAQSEGRLLPNFVRQRAGVNRARRTSSSHLIRRRQSRQLTPFDSVDINRLQKPFEMPGTNACDLQAILDAILNGTRYKNDIGIGQLT